MLDMTVTVDKEAIVPEANTPVPQLPGYPSYASSDFELVTPALAERYLSTMHSNRSRSRLEVAVHEQNLRNGTWFPEISPMFMDEGDRLADEDRSYDAQHRLEAIKNTGISAYMLVIRGVSAEAAQYIDTGRKRTYADLLRMGEVPDYKRQSVLTKYMALHQLYGVEGVRQPGRFAVSQDAKNKFLSTDAVMQSIHMGEALYRAVSANAGWAAYAVWRTGIKGTDGSFAVDPFWDLVRTGAGLELGDPALALRNWLMNGKKTGRKPADRRLMELFAYSNSWNKNVTGLRYQKVNPVFKTRRDGTSYFPAENVPDFLPREAGQMSRLQLSRAYAAMKSGRLASRPDMKDSDDEVPAGRE